MWDEAIKIDKVERMLHILTAMIKGIRVREALRRLDKEYLIINKFVKEEDQT